MVSGSFATTEAFCSMLGLRWSSKALPEAENLAEEDDGDSWVVFYLRYPIMAHETWDKNHYVTVMLQRNDEIRRKLQLLHSMLSTERALSPYTKVLTTHFKVTLQGDTFQVRLRNSASSTIFAGQFANQLPLFTHVISLLREKNIENQCDAGNNFRKFMDSKRPDFLVTDIS